MRATTVNTGGTMYLVGSSVEDVGGTPLTGARFLVTDRL